MPWTRPGSGAVDRAGSMDPRIQCALDRVRSSSGKRIPLQSMAAEVGLSPAHFSRLFKQETGTTFKRWSREERLARAVTLLSDPRLRIKEIATNVGYSATADFTRAFKARYGVAPSLHRKLPVRAETGNK